MHWRLHSSEPASHRLVGLIRDLTTTKDHQPLIRIDRCHASIRAETTPSSLQSEAIR
jgi:hypothetical protein